MIKVIKPGLLTSIQDLGRFNYQKYGVIASGAMDPIAHRLANLLVGNDENQPSMEMTLTGPTLYFEQDALIAICGGDLSPVIDNMPVPAWKTVLVRKGTQLAFGSAQCGCRAYLAVSGGFSVPSIMGSASTYLRANIGGYKGRTLKTDDVIAFSSPRDSAIKIMNRLRIKLKNKSFISADWSISPELVPYSKGNSSIRAMKGRQFQWFTEKSQYQFFHEPFTVTAKSDRMGYRLQGPPLDIIHKQEMISEAVTFGTIQVPSDGNPIVLLADRQTTGGYPKIAEIASVDLPAIAQRKPGDSIYFSEVTHKEAQLLYIEREKNLQKLKHGIAQKFQ